MGLTDSKMKESISDLEEPGRMQSPGVEGEQDLIPSIWQRLPADILEMVLTKLPLSVLKTFSGVSKSWKAFIRSEEFAHRCRSIEPTTFLFSSDSGKPFIAIPNLKTDSWERYFLKFIGEDESVDLLGTSEGLLCYRVHKKRTPDSKPLPNEEIFLIVHNPFTGKWRRFIVPYTFMSLDGMIGGLAVDQDTGSYKVILAFIKEHSPRTTFIYDSGANSWSVSASQSPALPKLIYVSHWVVSRSICCDGELYWLAEEVDNYHSGHFKTLIKYSTGLDTWSTSRQNLHCDVACGLHLTSFQKRPTMVKLRDSPENNVFLEELSDSGWNLTCFDAQDVARLIEAAEGELNKLKLKRALASGKTSFTLARALAECETWFIFYHDSKSRNLLCLKLQASSVTQLPQSGLGGDDLRSLGTFVGRLNSFV